MSNPSAEKGMRRKRERLRPFQFPMEQARGYRLALKSLRQAALALDFDTLDVADCLEGHTPSGVFLNSRCVVIDTHVSQEERDHD